MVTLVASFFYILTLIFLIYIYVLKKVKVSADAMSAKDLTKKEEEKSPVKSWLTSFGRSMTQSSIYQIYLDTSKDWVEREV